MKSFALTQEEIEMCIHGLICLYNEFGLDEKEEALLKKLEIMVTL